MHAKIYQLAAAALANVDKKRAAGVAAGLVASIAANRGHNGVRRAAEVAASTLNHDVSPGPNAPHAEATPHRPSGKGAAPQPAAPSPAAPDPSVTAAMLASAHAQANSLARRIYTPW